jgi:hypothetical protein
MIVVAIFRTRDFRTILTGRSRVTVTGTVETFPAVGATVEASFDVATGSRPRWIATALTVNAFTIGIAIGRGTQCYDGIGFFFFHLFRLSSLFLLFFRHLFDDVRCGFLGHGGVFGHGGCGNWIRATKQSSWFFHEGFLSGGGKHSIDIILPFGKTKIGKRQR